MKMVARWTAVAALVGCALPLPAAGNAGDATLALSAATARVGETALTVSGPAGAETVLQEHTGTGPVVVARPVLDGGSSRVAIRWTCARRRREFSVALASDPSQASALTVVTPTCRSRLALAAPVIVRTGSNITMRARDSWANGGIAGSLCDTPPGGVAHCQTLSFGLAAASSRSVQVAARRPGRWSLALTTAFGQSTLRRVVVRNPRSHLRVLATGDSMMRKVDVLIKRPLQRIPHVQVLRHNYGSTGISKPSYADHPLDWRVQSRRQMRGFPADFTIIFIGANDGWPLPTRRGTVACCGQAWIGAYGARVREMLNAYERRGSGRVYWITLPAPRDGRLATVFAAVNAAVLAQAATDPDGLRVVDVRPALTPGNQYRASADINGHLVAVREADGVHPTWAGAAIVAREVVAAMRSDGVLVQ